MINKLGTYLVSVYDGSISICRATVNGSDISYMVHSIDYDLKLVGIYLKDVNNETILNKRKTDVIKTWVAVDQLTVTDLEGNVIMSW